MQHHGVPQKLINIIQHLYEDSNCQIIHNGKLTCPLAVKTGVRQGCMLSPTIFLMAIDWIMKNTTMASKTGIQWTFKQLEDLGQTRFHHTATHMELQGTVPPKQNQNIQHQRKVSSPPLWIRNMESDQFYHQQTPDLCQQMPKTHLKHQVARQNLKR